MSSALAHPFFPGLKSRKAIRTAHWRTMASITTPFFSSCVRMRTNHLAGTVHKWRCKILSPEWVSPQPSQQFLAVILRYMNPGLFVSRVVCLPTKTGYSVSIKAGWLRQRQAILSQSRLQQRLICYQKTQLRIGQGVVCAKMITK